MSAWKSIKLLDGKQIPGIGFGFGTANYAKTGPNGINEELVEQCVQAITMAGYRHIDGAEGYSNETSQGAAIKKSGVPRNELFVTSKISRKESAKDVKATLQNQLKQLGLDHVDLYLVHSPLLGKIPEVWKQMEAVKKEGLATSIGVSNFRRRHLEELIAPQRRSLSSTRSNSTHSRSRKLKMFLIVATSMVSRLLLIHRRLRLPNSPEQPSTKQQQMLRKSCPIKPELLSIRDKSCSNGRKAKELL